MHLRRLQGGEVSVEYTAPCPCCGHDALWRSTVTSTGPTYLIRCNTEEAT